MTDVSIRPAAADGARAIQRVARDSWQAAYDTVLEANRIDETIDEWCDPERLVVDDIEQPERPVSVATIDNEVVGFVEAVPDENGDELAHLYRIYVAPGQWGRGIGGSLLDRVEAVLDERGFSRLRLSVLARNDVGVNFYESSGFRRTATTHDEHFGVQQYEYEKRL